MHHGGLLNIIGRFATAVALAGLLICAPRVSAAAEGPNSGAVSFSLGSDVATKYYFRGIIQEDEGFIAQPYAEVGFSVYEGDGPVSSITLSGGVWNSVHSEQTASGASSTTDVWYEADIYGGVSVGLPGGLEFSTTYTAYTSPSDAFATTQEVAFGLGFDDSELLGDFALSPSIAVAVETEGGADGGADRGTYFEISGGPEFALGEGDATLSVPLTLGLSLDDYYEGATGSDTFGYFQVGTVFGVPLSFIPAEFGSWAASAGAYFLTLGDTLRAANDGDDSEFFGIFGISMEY